MKKIVPLLLLLLLIVSCSLYAGGREEKSDEVINTIPEILPVTLQNGEKLRLIASTSIIGDVLMHISGNAADVTVLMKHGQNPHSFEPVPGDLRRVEQADIIFVNGFGLEENLLDDIHAAATGYIVPVSSGIEPLDFHAHEHEHEAGDPHVWMDPNNVMLWVQNMAAVLASADPGHADIYRINGETYSAELAAVDTYIRNQVGLIPEEKRILVLDHQMFNYFADEYEFTIIGTILPGTTDNAEPSPRAIAGLVDLIREYQVPAVFVGRTASEGLQKLAEMVIAEAGTEVMILSTLTGSLAAAGDRGDTYLDFLRFNTEQILKGLGE